MLHLTPVDQIRIRQDRNRKVFLSEHIQALAESISGPGGLIQLPVCRLHQDGSRELLAGERRLRAMQLIWSAGRSFNYMNQTVPPGQFPHALISEVDELTAREIELEENIQRVDLTWQERIQSIAELHELRLKQNPGQTFKATALELGYSGDSGVGAKVREATLLAKNLSDPDIAQAGSAKEALKKLTIKVEREFRAAAAVTAPVVAPSSKHTIHLADAMEFLLLLPSDHFDVVLTDPPYGVNAENFRASMTILHEYDDDWKTVEHLLQVFAIESFRITKKQAHLYVFCDVLMFNVIAEIFSDTGWDVWPRPMIWVKDVGHIPNATLGPQRRYECILYANKGKRPVTALYPDVISCPAVNEKFHAAQKPVDLYVNLLRRSVTAGDRVLDPFCGSGTIFEAAEQMKCLATGIEMDAASVQFAQERIATL